MPLLDQLQIFYGDCSPATAHVYARLPKVDDSDSWSLEGTVRGPECELARTLPATVTLADAGPGKDLLARTILPDPVFWSPDLPALYRVEMELRRKGEVVETAGRQLGIRTLGVRNKSLYLDGKRFVLRGVDARSGFGDSLENWREASAAMVLENPDDELCESASRLGVIVVATLTSAASSVETQVNRLSRWAAVAVAIVNEDIDASRFKVQAPNLLLAQSFAEGSEIHPQPWADLAICEVTTSTGFASQAQGCELPIVARRSLQTVVSIRESRRGCDHLQRDLAPSGDFAGYLV